ncbi:MAG: hypothetical protein E7369_06060 [Clostridiales bacterium]|nr:hypothetical protein [Clostridiales bacterium]
MVYEKKKLLIKRLVWAVLLALCILIPVGRIMIRQAKTPNIVYENGYLNDYYEYSDRSEIEIELKFDENVERAFVTVAFYDGTDKLLSREEGLFYRHDDLLSSTFFIDGEVDSYEIISYTIYYDEYEDIIFYTILFIIGTVFFTFFVVSMLLSCKVYHYGENEIIVYAGSYHHYLKINGEIFDEYNSSFSWGPIFLYSSLDDGTEINVTISTSNRIALKIDGKLYKGK